MFLGGSETHFAGSSVSEEAALESTSPLYYQADMVSTLGKDRFFPCACTESCAYVRTSNISSSSSLSTPFTEFGFIIDSVANVFTTVRNFSLLHFGILHI